MAKNDTLSPMIAVPYQERTLYIPQQIQGSEARTPDLMVKITIGGNAITKSTIDSPAKLNEYSQVNTFVYDVKREVNSDASRALNTNAQTFLSDITFVMPAEAVLAPILQNLLKGTMVDTIEFVELQNANDYNLKREITTFGICYFTHFQRFTTSWGGDSRINTIACSFRATSFNVALADVGQDGKSSGNEATGYDFKIGKIKAA